MHCVLRLVLGVLVTLPAASHGPAPRLETLPGHPDSLEPATPAVAPEVVALSEVRSRTGSWCPAHAEIRVIEPDPSIDFKIRCIRPDPRAHYTIQVIDPRRCTCSPPQVGPRNGDRGRDSGR